MVNRPNTVAARHNSINSSINASDHEISSFQEVQYNSVSSTTPRLHSNQNIRRLRSKISTTAGDNFVKQLERNNDVNWKTTPASVKCAIQYTEGNPSLNRKEIVKQVFMKKVRHEVKSLPWSEPKSPSQSDVLHRFYVSELDKN